MMASRNGGASPEEALKLSLQALASADLDAAVALMTGPQKQAWQGRIAAYGDEGARHHFRQLSSPAELERIERREELPAGRVLLQAQVRVQRDGQWSKDRVTHTYARDEDGLWRLWSF
jgi:hypothetical protein